MRLSVSWTSHSDFTSLAADILGPPFSSWSDKRQNPSLQTSHDDDIIDVSKAYLAQTIPGRRAE
jgi:hypothetical protein